RVCRAWSAECHIYLCTYCGVDIYCDDSYFSGYIGALVGAFVVGLRSIDRPVAVYGRQRKGQPGVCNEHIFYGIWPGIHDCAYWFLERPVCNGILGVRYFYSIFCCAANYARGWPGEPGKTYGQSRRGLVGACTVSQGLLLRAQL